MVKQILLASDGSACAQKAAESAAILAKQFGASLTLISVFPDVIPAMGVIDAGLAEQYLEAQEQSVIAEFAAVVSRTRDVTCSHDIDFKALEGRGVASDVISATASKINADLIVVGHRGLNALQSLILGSTSERVVRIAPCSVLVVR